MTVTCENLLCKATADNHDHEHWVFLFKLSWRPTYTLYIHTEEGKVGERVAGVGATIWEPSLDLLLSCSHSLPECALPRMVNLRVIK